MHQCMFVNIQNQKAKKSKKKNKIIITSTEGKEFLEEESIPYLKETKMC